ncbi:hypothetical protein E4T56_gene963 [Termitomyces sp. T112]|nr:hypothetical protein E4T56_gene963 [Termitomyces sp. T112]
MTANPKWSEIEEALLKEPAVNGKKQTAADQPDIVARVFELKKNAVVKEIKEGLFGSCVAYVHIIEFQKRGLPYMHILIFFHHHHRIKDAPDVDSIVSAQIPDPVAQPELYQDQLSDSSFALSYFTVLLPLQKLYGTNSGTPFVMIFNTDWRISSRNRLLQEETDYDVEELKRRVDENKARFNGEQLGASNEVMDSMDNNLSESRNNQYYLDCTILSGKNSDIEDINSEVLQKCPREEKILQSADSIISDDGNPNGLGLKHIKKDCKYCLSRNTEWFTNHLISIAGPCSIDILNGLQIISNIYQWTL